MSVVDIVGLSFREWRSTSVHNKQNNTSWEYIDFATIIWYPFDDLRCNITFCADILVEILLTDNSC
jgi:hypothetical protein